MPSDGLFPSEGRSISAPILPNAAGTHRRTGRAAGLELDGRQEPLAAEVAGNSVEQVLQGHPSAVGLALPELHLGQVHEIARRRATIDDLAEQLHCRPAFVARFCEERAAVEHPDGAGFQPFQLRSRRFGPIQRCSVQSRWMATKSAQSFEVTSRPRVPRRGTKPLRDALRKVSAAIAFGVEVFGIAKLALFGRGSDLMD